MCRRGWSISTVSDHRTLHLTLHRTLQRWASKSSSEDEVVNSEGVNVELGGAEKNNFLGRHSVLAGVSKLGTPLESGRDLLSRLLVSSAAGDITGAVSPGGLSHGGIDATIRATSPDRAGRQGAPKGSPLKSAASYQGNASPSHTHSSLVLSHSSFAPGRRLRLVDMIQGWQRGHTYDIGFKTAAVQWCNTAAAASSCWSSLMSSPVATHVSTLPFPSAPYPLLHTTRSSILLSVHIVPSTAAVHQCLLLRITVRELGMHRHPQGRSTVLMEIRWSPQEAKAKDERKEEWIVAHLYLRAST